MHTRELWKLGEKYVPYFRGVYPIDRLPKAIRAPSSLIINTDTHNKPGEHWLAVCFKRDGLLYAFDSFGFYYPRTLKMYLISRGANKIKYNKIKYQENHETSCGQYCVAWLIAMNYGSEC